MSRTLLILHFSNKGDELPKKIINAINDVNDGLCTQFTHISYKHLYSLNSLITRLNVTDYLSTKVILLLKCECIRFDKAIIQHIILSFPEVNVFFLEAEKEKWQDVIFITESEQLKTNPAQKIIDKRCIASRDSIIAPFHQISSNNPKEILLKILNYDNIYDISALRACAKKYKFEELNINDNFQKYTDYKLDHPAVSIDEESSTAEHLAYCLYACGYRALPISSYVEFRDIVQHLYSENLLILRDFDLQFADAPRNKEVPYKVYVQLNNKKKAVGIYDVDLIRGYKRLELSNDDVVWLDLTNKKVNNLHYCWNINKEQGKIYCVSQGYKGLTIDKKEQSWQIKGTKLSVPGIIKPLNGIYYSLYQADIVSDVKNTTRINPQGNNYLINRSRIKHQHSLPLDLYNIARPLLERANKYYLNNQFYLAAVLSQEAADIINGFHIGLMLEAYLVHAKAENAIAMSTAGCNEKDLAKDCLIRIDLIKSDVNRLVHGTDQDPFNILNQIFSDCRLYCKEKEHFGSEDVFISAMAELNEGISFKLPEKLGLLTYLKHLLAYLKGTFKQHKDFIYEQMRQFFEKVNTYGAARSKTDDGTNNNKENAGNGEKEE